MYSRLSSVFSCPSVFRNIRLPRMEKPTSSMGVDSAIDLEDRDPNNLNQHLQVCFYIKLIYSANLQWSLTIIVIFPEN